jgi:hypothetical protein
MTVGGARAARLTMAAAVGVRPERRRKGREGQPSHELSKQGMR